MGNESSRMIDDSVPPTTLRERSLSAVAELIKEGRARKIVVMTGAGISTAAGIPDFRSPKTGLYANLARLNLPYAEAVFDISYFRQNPEPFYVLAKELYPGKFQPTVSHAFIALLAKKRLLHMLFTQNIDCLERMAGVSADKIVEAHGSFATQRCIECKTEFPDEFMKEYVHKGIVPNCLENGCNGLVKPDIVFFGEKLPDRFEHNSFAPAMADLALVIGTSLTVWPFAGLPKAVAEGVPRLLFNLEAVGDLGSRADDVLELGQCDAGIRKLADELDWRDELEELWRGIVGKKEAERQISGQERMQEGLEEELYKLTSQIDTALRIHDEEAGPDDGAGEDHDSREANTVEDEIGERVPAPKDEDPESTEAAKDAAVTPKGTEKKDEVENREASGEKEASTEENHENKAESSEKAAEKPTDGIPTRSFANGPANVKPVL